MRLNRFEVTGYKNFRRAVALEDLAEVNVIHGENNVGKSNLLQAIDLFFWLLQMVVKLNTTLAKELAENVPAAVALEGGAPGIRFHLNESQLAQREFAADDIFNYDAPSPIQITCEVDASADDWKQAGAEVSRPTRATFTFRVTRAHRGCVDVEARLDAGEAIENHWEALRTLAALLASDFNLRTDAQARGFILVDVFRRVIEVDGQDYANNVRRPVPQDLLLKLYDAKESVEPGLFRRWELFERLLNSLGPALGGGRFVITYKRSAGRAILALQRGNLRIPIDAMGSGVQQVVSLLARMLLANSAVVAVEEPELHLRYEMQLRLRDMFREIVESGDGPSQILLTSHSPAFEVEEPAFFYGMRAGEEGPVVERRAAREAPAFTEQTLRVQLPAPGGPNGYVSADGLIRLPDEIRKRLDVEHGGGVVVLQRDDHRYVEILRNEEFLELCREGEG